MRLFSLRALAWISLAQRGAQRDAAALIERLRRAEPGSSGLLQLAVSKLAFVDPSRLGKGLAGALRSPRFGCEALASEFALECEARLFCLEERGPAWRLALASSPLPFPEGSLGAGLLAAAERAHERRLQERSLRSAASGCSRHS